LDGRHGDASLHAGHSLCADVKGFSHLILGQPLASRRWASVRPMLLNSSPCWLFSGGMFSPCDFCNPYSCLSTQKDEHALKLGINPKGWVDDG
jgi:hypothetical protein